jgi:hypothetical protein
MLLSFAYLAFVSLLKPLVRSGGGDRRAADVELLVLHYASGARVVWIEVCAMDEKRLVGGWPRRCAPDGSGPWKVDVVEWEDFGKLVEVGVAVK